VPGPGHGSLLGHLASQWPAFIAYVISFFTIGIIWVNHHALVRNIALVDRTLLFLNLLLLTFVVAIPFGTATMAGYLSRGGQDSRVAMALYAAILEGMSLGFLAIFEWALHDQRRMHHPVPTSERSAARRRFYVGQFPYLIAIGVAFVSPPAALAIIGLVAVYYIFERTPSAPAAPGPDAGGGDEDPDRWHPGSPPRRSG
jgi:uncharacterized membrane protein